MYDDKTAPAVSEGLAMPDEGPLLTRRNTLQGFAWAAPAIVVARAVPAVAGSGVAPAGALPQGQGLTPTFNTAQYTKDHWVESAGGKVKAVVAGMYIQNLDPNQGVPASATMTLTLVVPIRGGSNHRWGFGGEQGIPSGMPWTLASYSTTSTHATLVLVYTGPGMGAWGGVSLSNLWIESQGSTARERIEATINATYRNGATSPRVDSATVA